MGNTLQAVHNEVDLFLHEHGFQFMCPQALRSKVVQGCDLILVPHCAYSIYTVLILWRHFLKHSYDKMCLGYSKRRLARANVDYIFLC